MKEKVPDGSNARAHPQHAIFCSWFRGCEFKPKLGWNPVCLVCLSRSDLSTRYKTCQFYIFQILTHQHSVPYQYNRHGQHTRWSQIEALHQEGLHSSVSCHWVINMSCLLCDSVFLAIWGTDEVIYPPVTLVYPLLLLLPHHSFAIIREDIAYSET